MVGIDSSFEGVQVVEKEGLIVLKAKASNDIKTDLKTLPFTPMLRQV